MFDETRLNHIYYTKMNRFTIKMIRNWKIVIIIELEPDHLL